MVTNVDPRLRDYIRKYIMSRSPGIYVLLNRAVSRELGTDLVDAVIKKPRELLDFLKRFYKDDMEAVFIFRSLLIKPLAMLAGDPDLEARLYRASLQGCQALVDELRGCGLDIDSSLCEE